MKEQRGRFLGMLLGTLGANFSKNMSAAKVIVRAGGRVVRARDGVIRADDGFSQSVQDF